jgi:hypothetical protein
MTHALGELAAECGSRLKIWISYPDSGPSNLAIVEELLSPLVGLSVNASGPRWVPLVASSKGQPGQEQLPEVPPALASNPPFCLYY